VDCTNSGDDKTPPTRREPRRRQIQLTAEELGEIDRSASQIEVRGARYPEAMLKMVGR
jgi:hypothetical protein